MNYPTPPTHSQSLSDKIEQLRSHCQINILPSWVCWRGDLEITDVMQSNLLHWQPIQLNDKQQVVWNQGKHILWLGQKFTVPESLYAYPLNGLCARLALTWWADAVEVYLNGNLLSTGDLFDCSPRLLLSQGVKSKDEFFIVLRLVSPEHCDGALMHSQMIFESGIVDDIDPGLIANELAIAQTRGKSLSSTEWNRLVTEVEELINFSRGIKTQAEWKSLLEKIRQTYLGIDQLTSIKNNKLFLLGHAHLDLAWLWPVQETWKVAQNTFESVLKLQTEFSELIFCHTTPALYAWMEEHQSWLFTQIQTQVKLGKWEVLGGFWVEPDLNLISGESIVRQLLYGQLYFLEKFGKISPIVWVPDTFGFCGTLPGFLTQAGIEFFVTQKLRWNDTSQFDYDLFWWQSPDGSQILSYMSPPIGETIDPVKMTDYLSTWETKTGLANALWLPGVGDHGGGPTRDMLELARKWKNSPIFPETEFSTAENYCQYLKSSVAILPEKLPVWQDELYLQFHRGCYTTHADQKRWNRQCENLLYQAELFSTLATAIYGLPYPKTEIETAWKKVLFHQFHDILPGSSITQVYQDALPEWQEVQQLGSTLLDRSLRAIACNINLPKPPQPDSIPVIIFNSLNWERSEVVKIKPPHPQHWLIHDLDGNQLPYQITRDGLLFIPTIPSIGYQIYWLSPGDANGDVDENKCGQESYLEFCLENEYLLVRVKAQTGDLESVFDKIQLREVLQGAGNQLQAFADKGQYWDAWNIDPDYQSKPLPPAKLQSIEWLEKGIIQQRLRVVRQIGRSQFTQDYVLQTSCPILKIENSVNWQEDQVLVKTSFLLNLHSDIATYEIPCGVIHRPTHPHTPSQEAKWEVPALKWADLTADTNTGNYGVSLLNDCKYGYDIKGNQMRLTLLRSPHWPDPQADRGEHQFNYALYPHTGSWQAAETVKKAYNFNIPLNVLLNPETKKSPSPVFKNNSFLTLTADNLIITAFKVSENHPQNLILRFYECHGESSSLPTLNLKSEFFTLGNPVDLLERNILPTVNPIAPWKISTFQVITQER